MHATARSTLGVALAVAAIAMAFLQAALPAEPPADCTAAIVSLSPCVDFITGGSSTPLPACCSQLATVAGSEPRCLCAVLNGGAAQFGVVVNRTQALALPGACKVQTPPVSRCDASNGPSAAPSSPSGGDNSNGGNSAGISVQPTSLLASFSIFISIAASISIPPMFFL